MTRPVHDLELLELAALIRSREVSPTGATRALLDRIAAVDGTLKSYALVMAEAAMEQAETAEAEIAAGRYRGSLHGVPIAVKDLFWTKGFVTAAGTVIHKGFCPNEDATAVARLKDAGAVIVGKLQMTEGAYSDHHPSIKPPLNPWNAAYWTGISSSGPGAAIAAGLCFGALASDTGGSIRWPSAANGVTGLKPTWGRVSRHGAFELAASLDHVGSMARSAADCGALLSAIAGSDPTDPTALPDPVPDYGTTAAGDLRGLLVGVDRAWNDDDDGPTQGIVAQALGTLRDLGAEFVEVAFPDVRQVLADWSPICAVEAAVAHEATYPSRKDAYGPALTSLLDAALALSAGEYQRLLVRRRQFCARADALFGSIDLLLTPVQPFVPPTVAEMRTFVEQPEFVSALQRYTAPFDMTGHPTITLPAGFTDAGLPMGVQLVAGNLEEATLLRAGTAFQGATSWHRRRPSGFR